jgi:hypothetical protein
MRDKNGRPIIINRLQQLAQSEPPTVARIYFLEAVVSARSAGLVSARQYSAETP